LGEGITFRGTAPTSHHTWIERMRSFEMTEIGRRDLELLGRQAPG